MRNYSYNVDYETNPFANLMQTPYVSQRVQFPFEDYLRTLQLTEQNRQKSLAEQSQLDLLLNTVETLPNDNEAKKRLESIKSNIDTQIGELSGGKFGFADPNAQDKLRVLAKDVYTNKDLKHISEFTNSWKADQAKLAEISKTKQIANIGDTTQSAYNEKGEPTQFSSGWVIAPDYAETKNKIWSSVEKDIKTEAMMPDTSNVEDAYIKLKEVEKAGFTQQKIDEAANLYAQTEAGVVEAKELAYREKIPVEQAVEEVKNNFKSLHPLYERIKEDERYVANANKNTNPNNLPENGSFVIPSHNSSASYDWNFKDYDSFLSQKNDGSIRGAIKDRVLSSIAATTPEIQSINSEIVSLLKDKGKLNVVSRVRNEDGTTSEKETDSISRYVKDGKIFDPQGLINYIEQIKSGNPNWKDLTKVQELTNKYKEVYENKLKDFVSNENSDFGVTVFSLNDVYNPDAKLANQSLGKLIKEVPQEKFVYEGKDKNSKITDITGFYRIGTDVRLVLKDDKGNFHDGSTTDDVVKKDILASYGRKQLIKADQYKNSELTKDGFTINGKEYKIPSNVKIIGDNSGNSFGYKILVDEQEIPIGIYDMDNRLIPATNNKVSSEDYFYIIDTLIKNNLINE